MARNAQTAKMRLRGQTFELVQRALSRKQAWELRKFQVKQERRYASAFRKNVRLHPVKWENPFFWKVNQGGVYRHFCCCCHAKVHITDVHWCFDRRDTKDEEYTAYWCKSKPECRAFAERNLAQYDKLRPWTPRDVEKEVAQKAEKMVEVKRFAKTRLAAKRKAARKAKKTKMAFAEAARAMKTTLTTALTKPYAKMEAAKRRRR